MLDAQSLNDRQAEILALAERDGFVTLEALAALFGVSMQTVRRDIIALDRAGLLQRFHGGAGRNGDGESLAPRSGYTPADLFASIAAAIDRPRRRV